MILVKIGKPMAYQPRKLLLRQFQFHHSPCSSILGPKAKHRSPKATWFSLISLIMGKRCKPVMPFRAEPMGSSKRPRSIQAKQQSSVMKGLRQLMAPAVAQPHFPQWEEYGSPPKQITVWAYRFDLRGCGQLRVETWGPPAKHVYIC